MREWMELANEIHDKGFKLELLLSVDGIFNTFTWKILSEKHGNWGKGYRFDSPQDVPFDVIRESILNTVKERTKEKVANG